MLAKYFSIIQNYVLSVSSQIKYHFYHQNTLLDAFRRNSRNIIGRNPSMVIPLLANQDLTPMLATIPSVNNEHSLILTGFLGDKKQNYDALQKGASQKINTSSRRQDSDMNLSTKSLTMQIAPIEGLNQEFPQRYHSEKEMKPQSVVPRKILEGDINGESIKNNLSKMLKLIELQPTLNSTVSNGQEISLQNIPFANKDKSVSQRNSKAEADSAMCRFDTGRAIIIVRQAQTKLPTEEEPKGWNSTAQTKTATLNDSTVVKHRKNSGVNTSKSCSGELTRGHFSNNQYAEGGQVPSSHENRLPTYFELQWDKDQCHKYMTKALLQNTWLSSHVRKDKDCHSDFSKINVRPSGLCINSNTESLTSTAGKLREQSSMTRSKEDENFQGISNDSHEKRLSTSIGNLDEIANFKFLAHICNSAQITESNNYMEEKIAESTHSNKGKDNSTSQKTVNTKDISNSEDLAGAKPAPESGGSVGSIEDEKYSSEILKLDISQEEFSCGGQGKGLRAEDFPSDEQGKGRNADENCTSLTNASCKRLLKKGDAIECITKYQDVGARRYSTGMMATGNQMTSDIQMHTSVASQFPAIESQIKVSKMEPREEHMGELDEHRRTKRPFELTHMDENDSRYLTEILGKRSRISP